MGCLRSMLTNLEKTSEQWKPVVGYEGLYEVSDRGRVKRVKDAPGTWVGRILKPGVIKGHAFVRLSGKTRQVHRLMLESFVGPAPDNKPLALHRDDDGLHNVLTNLYWGSYSDNKKDEVRNGRNFNRSKTTCARGHEFTEDNTYVCSQGKRSCRECRRIRDRENWRRDNPPKGNYNSNKTHCKHGHEFTDENTYVGSSGKRACKECSRTAWRDWYRRKKQLKNQREEDF